MTSRDGREKLAIIESQVRVMSQAIRNALDQTRTPTLQRQPVAVVPLIEDTLLLLAPVLRAKRIAVARDLTAAPSTIAADPRGLQQILLNVLTNAVDALDEGGSIVVAAEAVTDNGGPPGLLVRISDNGKGIRSVCRRFVVLCRDLKLFSQAMVAIDGSKFKAVNSRRGEGTTVEITIGPGEAA